MKFHFYEEGDRMNTGCFKCDKAQWDADGCTCEITGSLVGNAERGCEYRKDTKLKPCPFCGGEAELTHTNDNNHYPFVRCKYGAYLKPKCMANMYPWLNYKTDEEAIEAWNRRTK